MDPSSLIPCPQCGHKMSEADPACPHCGASPARRRRMLVLSGGLFALSLVFLLMAKASHPGAPPAAPPQAEQPAPSSKGQIQFGAVAPQKKKGAQAGSSGSGPSLGSVRRLWTGAGGFYKRRGNIEDIVCRPRKGEPEERWRKRVPAHCQD